MRHSHIEEQAPDDEEVLRVFGGVRGFQKGDRRAPHKPLLLLMALAALKRDGDRWLTFSSIESALAALIRDFGPDQAQVRPGYPFWRLRNDGVWEVPEAPQLADAVNAAGDVSVIALRRENAHGGLTGELYAALRSRPRLLNAVAAQILDESFPQLLHEPILDAIGLSLLDVRCRRRDPGFRDLVLRIYERRCAICGYDGRLGTTEFGLDAAHIKWHAAGGPDSEDNGVALCSLHHVALDRGAVTIDKNLCIQVSQHAVGGDRMQGYLIAWAGRPIRRPQPGASPPDTEFLDWHWEWVFRKPARVALGDSPCVSS